MAKITDILDMGAPKLNDLSKTFNDQGFIVIDQLFGAEFIRNMRSAAESRIELASRIPEDVFSNYYLPHRPDQGVLYDLYQRFPEFREMAENQILLCKLKELMGPNFVLYENSLVYKPKKAENEVPWHQDFMNRVSEPTKFIVWMPLDNVTEENGALYVIPGSHKGGFRNWHKKRGQTHHTRAQLSPEEESKKILVTLNAGDVLIFHHLLLHSSPRVLDGAPRKVYRIAIQNFERSCVPRGAPIILSCDDVTGFQKEGSYFSNKWIVLLKKIGTRLAHFKE